jgi:hypothetical protein
MKSFVKKFSKALLLVPATVLTVAFVAVPASAQCDVTQGASEGALCAKPNNVATQLFGTNSIFNTVTNIMLFLIGAISVVMLIIGGIRYVLSGGDQSSITSAKNTILYAIIGIVVAFLAYAAVNFVTTQLQKNAAYQPSHVVAVR